MVLCLVWCAWCGAAPLSSAEEEKERSLAFAVMKALNAEGKSLDTPGYQQADHFHVLSIAGTRDLSYKQRRIAKLQAQGLLLDKVVEQHQQSLSAEFDDIAPKLGQPFRQRLSGRGAVIPRRDSFTVVVVDESVRVESNVPYMISILEKGDWHENLFAGEALLRVAHEPLVWLRRVGVIIPQLDAEIDERCYNLQAVQSLLHMNIDGFLVYKTFVMAQEERLSFELAMLEYLYQQYLAGTVSNAWLPLLYTTGVYISPPKPQPESTQRRNLDILEDVARDLSQDNVTTLPPPQDANAWLRQAFQLVSSERNAEALLALRHLGTLKLSQKQESVYQELWSYLIAKQPGVLGDRKTIANSAP